MEKGPYGAAANGFLACETFLVMLMVVKGNKRRGGGLLGSKKDQLHLQLRPEM